MLYKYSALFSHCKVVMLNHYLASKTAVCYAKYSTTICFNSAFILIYCIYTVHYIVENLVIKGKRILSNSIMAAF